MIKQKDLVRELNEYVKCLNKWQDDFEKDWKYLLKEEKMLLEMDDLNCRINLGLRSLKQNLGILK